MASVLYRVAQEGVRNAIQHGAPAQIDIRITTNEREARLEISDDGRGFDAASTTQPLAGTGLFALRERLSLVDGVFEITSRPGNGTRLRATVPFISASQP
jgi:signal transduction histidine kinase